MWTTAVAQDSGSSFFNVSSEPPEFQPFASRDLSKFFLHQSTAFSKPSTMASSSNKAEVAVPNSTKIASSSSNVKQ